MLIAAALGAAAQAQAGVELNGMSNNGGGTNGWSNGVRLNGGGVIGTPANLPSLRELVLQPLAIGAALRAARQPTLGHPC